MRWAIGLALAVLAAGCIMPDQATTTSPLIGYCPQWVAGPETVPGGAALDATSPTRSIAVDAPAATLGRHPLDMYRIRVERLDLVGGDLEVHAAVGNTTHGLNFYDYRSAGQPFQSVPVLVFRPGGNETHHDFDVLLHPLSEDANADVGPLRLDVAFAPGPAPGHATLEYTVSFLYRVCGAVT
ncbi:MAG: hypothetical protein ABR562_03885 [Thermoplasmatota archaeon]|nr:hypothetical protein [Halobacteriales archaeon]